MRSMLCRFFAFALGLPLLASGAVGALAHLKYGPEGLPRLRGEVPKLVASTPLQQLARISDDRWSWVDPLGQRPVHAAVAGLGLALLGFAGWPSGRKTKRKATKKSKKAAQPTPETQEAGFGNVDEVDLAQPRKSAKKIQRAAAQIEEEEGAEAAAAHLLDHGMKDEAVELLLSAELFDRAAEIRYDQNRFDEAAQLYVKADRHEAAGGIYAQVERYEEAAECYARADKPSIAGEMYERAGCHEKAGRCYAEIGFHRHAAQSYLRAGREPEAADALVAAFAEEGGGTAGINDGKAKELRGLAKKAGELLAKMERFEEAENILVRAGAFGRAAKIAYQTGAYERAAELFLRIGRGDLAAKALGQGGDEVSAARHLGEYLRDKGDDAQAIEHLARAGESASAGDLCRKLSRFDEAAEHYWTAEDFGAAAEMFRAAGNSERAAEAYERCGSYDLAAECFEQSGNALRRAQLLEKAGRLFEAGKLLAEGEQPDEAIRLLQQVTPDDSQYGAACSLLGSIFNKKGMHDLSLKKLEEAASNAGVTRDNANAFYDLAVALDEKGDFSRAAEIYEKILSFDYHYRDVADRQEQAKSAAERQAATQTSPPGSSPTLTGLPQTTQRYEILRELGRGGMGVVHLARDSVLEREVAYKVLPEGLRGNPNALKNFLREAKAAAQLNHPNIVTVYDAGESEHGFYLAMELVQGTTLKDVLRHRGPVAPGGVIYILRQMAEALAYAHGKKVVHRDIKTANTMWTIDKQVKIMDFGLAKLMEEVRNATTMISGTPFYMSPEQTLGRNVDHRTDIYSLGVTMFELATGDLPFRKGNVPYHHVHSPPPDPRELKPDLPSPLAGLILKCLEKDPEARFQSARELVQEIDRLSGRG